MEIQVAVEPERRPLRPGKDEWWRGAVIYEIYPRSFQDANGDGIGDLAGITRRLPYIAELGVDAVWIAPFFASPMRDFGYDVSDYTAVDPMFGTLEDFDALVATAHDLGVRVLIDQVLSHTSDAHAWFRESRLSRENPKADWYVWADARPDGTPPNNWLSVFGGSAWEWDTRRGQYYLHNFHTTQPDLNFHNEAVQAALLDEVEFWLKRGVDGFRLDTTNFYYCSAGLEDNPPAPPDDGASRGRTLVNPYHWQQHVYDSNRPENLIFLRRLRLLLDRYPERTSVGEIGSGPRSLDLMAAYTSGGDKLHMCYTFDFLGPVFGARHFRSHIEAFEAVVDDGWPCWAFSNHDVVRHVSRWGYHGGGDSIARLAPAILLALRGSVCIYQGEELGLTEAELEFGQLVDPYGMRFWPEIKGRDGCRTPMVWEADAANGGFSTGHPWLPVAPEHLARAVDRSAEDAGSTLSHYRRLIAFRRAHPALRVGTIRMLDAPPDTLAFVRTGAGESLICLFNLGPSQTEVDLPPDMKVRALDGHGFDGTVVDDRTVRLPAGEAFFGAVV